MPRDLVSVALSIDGRHDENEFLVYTTKMLTEIKWARLKVKGRWTDLGIFDIVYWNSSSTFLKCRVVQGKSMRPNAKRLNSLQVHTTQWSPTIAGKYKRHIQALAKKTAL